MTSASPESRARISSTSDLLTSGAELSDILMHLAGRAREVTKADFSAVCVMDEDGRPERMVYSGLGDAVARDVTRLPVAAGLLGLIAQSTVPVRLADVEAHPSFKGWPAGHPPIGPLLGIPIRGSDRTIACIYAARSPGLSPFDEAAESAVTVLSLQGAISLASALAADRSGRLFALGERQRIAHDLRDATVQSLHELQRRLVAVAGADPEAVCAAIMDEAEAVGGLIAELDQYVGMLEADEPHAEPDLARDLPFVIRQLVPQGIATVLNVTAVGLIPVSARDSEDLLHIAREALSNAVRHAKPSKIGVDLRRAGASTSLTIQDDGIGFDAAKAHVGIGTTGMRSRAGRLGADLMIIGIPGMGTTVRVTLDD